MKKVFNLILVIVIASLLSLITLSCKTYEDCPAYGSNNTDIADIKTEISV